MQEINKWVGGCKVRAFDWIDGENLYMNIQYFKPGSSIERPPALEKSVLIAKTPHNEEMMREYLDSIVNGIMFHGVKMGLELS